MRGCWYVWLTRFNSGRVRRWPTKLQLGIGLSAQEKEVVCKLQPCLARDRSACLELQQFDMWIRHMPVGILVFAGGLVFSRPLVAYIHDALHGGPDVYRDACQGAPVRYRSLRNAGGGLGNFHLERPKLECPCS